jgi:hypothetical protein
MNKSELFQILSDPNCDPKYIVRALRLYNPDEIIKVPAISLRFLYGDFPTNAVVNFWFTLIKNQTFLCEVKACSKTVDLDIIYYLQAYYTQDDSLFFANMTHITNKNLLRKLLNKFRKTNSEGCLNYKKQCALSLYAYDLISFEELDSTIKKSLETLPNFLGYKTTKRMARGRTLAEKLYKKSKTYDLVAELVAVELLEVYFSYCRHFLKGVRESLGLFSCSETWQNLLRKALEVSLKNVTNKDNLQILQKEIKKSEYCWYNY